MIICVCHMVDSTSSFGVGLILNICTFFGIRCYRVVTVRLMNVCSVLK